MSVRLCVFAAAGAAILATGAAAQERVVQGNLVMERVPEIPAEVTDRLLQYQNTRSAGFASWAPGADAILISTRFGQTNQAHRVDTPMGARRQLTFFSEPVGVGEYRPGADPRQFAYTRDRGGDEMRQVYVFDEATGISTRYSDGAQQKSGVVWSDDGSMMAWSTTFEASGDRGVIIARAGDPDSRRQVFRGSGGAWFPNGWSPDGSRLALTKYVSSTESEIYLLDVESGALTQINPSAATIAYRGLAFAADGGLYFASNEEGEFFDLFRYDPESGEKTNLTADIDWDVEGWDLSRDGRHYAFSVNAGGRSEMHIRRSRNDRAVAGPDLPPGIISGIEFSPDGRKIGFTFNAATSPSDAWSYNLESRRLTRWTQSEVGGLDPASFIEPEFISFESFDGLEIPAFIYRPEGPGPHPVVISIHGGPEGQARPRFSSTFQQWASDLGIAVIVPNVRGSAGYGKSYLLMDNGMKREDSVRDIGALLDWIDARPDLDSDRVMVYGGSYGGYMVLASMVHYNDRLAGGVDIVGISDFITFLENTSDYRRDLRRAEYGDERDPEMRAYFERIAPANQVDRITKPLFIIQGANDPRVPASESEQILARMKENGAEPWFLMAMDEGHGFRKKSNRDFMAAAVVMFFEEYLLD